jgi:hypothetical protein
MGPPDPQMERAALAGSPNSIANTQPNKTIAAEEISQAVIGENPSAVVLYLQRRFGLLPATAVVVAELALFARRSR